MHRSLRRWSALAVLACWLLLPWCAWATPLAIDDLDVLVDPSGTETVASVSAPAADARFQALAGGLARGFTSDVVWLRFQVRAPVAGDWWLEVRPVTLDDVRLYEPAANGHLERRNGRLVPIDAREHNHPGFVFKLDLPDTAPRTYYLRLQSRSSLAARLVLWDPEQFIHAKWTQAGGMGLLAGVLLALLVFNLALWCQLRERALLWSACYILSLGTSWFFWFGYGAGLLFPEAPELNIRLVDMSSALYGGALSALMYSLFQMARALPERRWPFWLPALQALLFPLDLGHAWQPAVRTACMVGSVLWLLWLLRHSLREFVGPGDWTRRLLLAAVANVQVCNILMGLAVVGALRDSSLPPIAYLLAGGSSLFSIQLAMVVRIHRVQGRHLDLARQVALAEAETAAQMATQRQLSDALAELDRAQIAGRFGCWHWDKASGRIELSRATEHVVGPAVAGDHDPAAAFLARLTATSRAALQQAMAAARDTATPFVLEVEQVGTDAAPQWLELHGTAVRSPDGQLLGMSGTLQDISERRALANARTSAEADRLSRARESVFLSRASHELRTPLNAVMGLTQLLADNPTVRADPALRQQTTLIVQASDELRALIDDILDLAALQRGAVPPPTQRVDIAPMLSQCVAMLQPLARARGVTLRLGALAPDGGVEAHPDRLRQCLLNLLRNAVQYNRYGGSVTVSISGQAGPSRDPDTSACLEDRLCIDVADTGRGMTPAQCRSLFEPFNRLGAEVTAIEGRGLGLSVTRQLVQAMGGELCVRSEVGQGTTATLLLRRAARYASGSGLQAMEDAGLKAGSRVTPATEPAPAQAPPGKAGEAAMAPMTVLYVEDNRLNATVMRQAVRRLAGVRLLVSPSAESALTLMQELRPDLLLIDINLPGISGIELRRRLKTMPRLADVPSVAVSADATAETLALAAAEGFADYITKPFRIDRIPDVLTAFRITRRTTAPEHGTPALSA